MLYVTILLVQEVDLNRTLLYKKGEDFLDRQYKMKNLVCHKHTSEQYTQSIAVQY